MKLEYLEAENFLTLGNAKLELADRGLLLIQGENSDDTSAKSNGAGKSSLVDAVSWLNFGETARGVSGDDVVNDKAGKGTRVFGRYSDGKDKIEVARHRKHKEGKNSLQLKVNGTDMTKGTDKETQIELEKLLGCTADVFNAAVYAGQERMPDLPGMTDKQLKLLIEESAGTEVLAAAYNIASEKANALEKRVATSEANVRGAADVVESAKRGLTELEVKRDEFNGSRVVRATVERDKAKEHLALSGKFKAELAAAQALRPMTTLKAEADDLKAKIDADKPNRERLAKLQAELNTAERDKVRVGTMCVSAKADAERAAAAVAGVDGDVGKPCGECGKPYSEHDLADVKAHRLTFLESAKIKLADAAASLRSVEAHRAAAELAVNSFKEAMTDMAEVVAALRSVEGEISAQEILLKQASDEETRARDALARAGDIMRQANPFDLMIERAQERLEVFKKELVAATEAHELITKEHEVAAAAVKVFGPAGVRAHILDTVTPALNDWTKDYLGALADGNIHATWTTLSKTAKGEAREKFSIEVTNTKGAKSFSGLSGGEKRKVRLACALALQDLVASRATKPIDLFIADEVDQALDEAGLERLMGVLERKARERGTVIVISHNSLADWIDQVITVTKKEGVSTVSGATTASGAW